jgi:hypothetical protein
MGKLILCSGAKATKPYTFTRNGIRIYSMEELCYYLYQHVHLIDETMLSDELFHFIGRELMLPERASKLLTLKKQKADLKTLVTVIMCSTDYYTEHEIKSLLKVLDEVTGMPIIKRNIIKAGYYLKEEQYQQAVNEYVQIIHSPEAIELTPEEYGDVFHNLAVAKVHITGLKEASKLFAQAYERNHKEETLKQYLYTLWLINKEEKYPEKIEAYQVSEGLDQEISAYLSEMEQESENTSSMQSIERLSELRTLGKMNEFYRQVNEIIDTWKEKVRQS